MNHLDFIPLLIQITEILFLAGLYVLPLRKARGCVLLTIPVEPQFFASEEARKLTRRYITADIALTLFALAIAFLAWSRHSGVGFAVASSLQVATLPLLWALTYRSVLPHRVAQPVVRTASLNGPSSPSAAWFAVTLASLLPLIASSAFVANHLDRVPLRYPDHWGWHGEANGWAVRDGHTAYVAAIAGASLVLLLMLLGWVTARYSASSSARPQARQFTLTVACAAAWFVAIGRSGVTLLPVLPSYGVSLNRLALAGGALTVAFFISVAVYGWTIYRAAPVERTTPAEAFVGGMFYYNPADAAVLVPKRIGLGYTVNFARPAAWLLVGGAVLVALAPVGFEVYLHAH